MNKNIRVEKALSSRRLLTFVFDSLLLVASIIGLYFVFLYAVMNPTLDYQNHKNNKKQIEAEYGLNLETGLSYTEYEQVIQRFYLQDFHEEIKRDINSNYGTNYTINHIYNVVVLQLPDIPTPEKYKTTFFQYRMDEDGHYLVDELAILVEGNSGPVYEKNMRDLFYTTYARLPDMLKDYHSDYKESLLAVDSSEILSRLIASIISFTILFEVFTLINPYGSSTFEKLYKIGYVNSKSGYMASKGKLFIYHFFNHLIPFVGIVLFSRYSIVLLTVLFVFINEIVMIFSKENRTLVEKIFKLDAIDLSTSLVFKNRKEEREYENSEEHQIVSDQDYLDKLSNTDKI